MTPSDGAYLTAQQLSDRWHIKRQTLANWRHAGKGPPFIRVGARVLYPTEGIQAYEKLSPNWLAADNINPQQST